VFLLATEENLIYDSLEKERKRVYQTEIQLDPKTKIPKRKTSSIKEYGITVADAAITDVDYEDKVDEKLVKIIDAVTKSSISKQELMTAQQQTLTAKAKGEQALVEIEYQQKQEQTKQVVAAQTKVAVAEQNKLEQKINVESAGLEAQRTRILADADAYKKKTVLLADGALEQKLKAWTTSQQYQWEAFGKFQDNLVPQIQTGNSSGSGSNALQFMEMMSMKAAKDLSLDLNKRGN